jgi:hypothetical protein
MLETEHTMQVDIADGRDCSRSAQTLIGQRRQMARLASQRKALGDLTPLGVEFRQPSARRKPGSDTTRWEIARMRLGQGRPAKR